MRRLSLKDTLFPQSKERRSSKKIDKEIKQFRDELKRREQIPQILILGSAESGKTTILKQLRIMHGEKFSSAEMDDFKAEMHQNIGQICSTVFSQCTEHDIWEDEEETKFASLANPPDELIDLQTAKLIATLWKLPHVKNAILNEHIKVPTNTAYFLSRIESVVQPDYELKMDNILYIRTETKVINETELMIGESLYKFIEVNGNIANQKAWVPFFDTVQCIIFVCPISEYDEMDAEGVNRMADAISLFGEIYDQKLLQNTQKIVFLNKTDLLKKKAKVSLLCKHFKDAPRTNVHSSICDYFTERFKAYDSNLLVHTTSATDSALMAPILQSVFDSISAFVKSQQSKVI